MSLAVSETSFQYDIYLELAYIVEAGSFLFRPFALYY